MQIPCPHCEGPFFDTAMLATMDVGFKPTTLGIRCGRCPFMVSAPFILDETFVKLVVEAFYEPWLRNYLSKEHGLVQLAKIAGYDEPAAPSIVTTTQTVLRQTLEPSRGPISSL